MTESTYGPRSLEMARGLSELAGPALAGSRYQRAESLLTRSLELRRDHLPPNHPDLAVDLSQLAWAAGDLGRYERADSLFRGALDILDDPTEPREELRATTLANHGLMLLDWGRLDQAQEQLEASLALREQIYGQRHPQVAVTLGHLARLARDQGRLTEAEALYRDVLDWAPGLVGDGAGWITTWNEGLSAVFLSLGRNREALELQEEVVAVRRDAQDPDQLATALNNLATLLWRRGDPIRAVELQTRVLELDRAQLGEEHHWVATDLTAVGNYYLYAGDLERAGTYLREGLDLIRELR